MTVARGSVDLVAGRTFEVVVANLDSATLVALAASLRDAMAGDGTLIAAGVGNARSEEVRAALGVVGLDVVATPGGEWTLLRAVRTGS